MATLNTSSASTPWSLTTERSGKITINTKESYLDRNIEITIPEGVLSSTGGSVTAVNASLSTVNNGISVTGLGKGQVSTSGWIDAGTANDSASMTKYISDVTIEAPTSGENIFGVKTPQGNFYFHVMADGSVHVTDSAVAHQ